MADVSTNPQAVLGRFAEVHSDKKINAHPYDRTVRSGRSGGEAGNLDDALKQTEVNWRLRLCLFVYYGAAKG